MPAINNNLHQLAVLVLFVGYVKYQTCFFIFIGNFNMRPLIAGNWKMNGSIASGAALVAAIMEQRAEIDPGCDILVCPPFLAIRTIGDLIQNSPIFLGAQDCHKDSEGAHTGDVSAKMLSDVGCEFVIVGHSERRANHREIDETVLFKAEAAHANNLSAIICVGETLVDRQNDKTLSIIENQFNGSVPKSSMPNNTVIAYEPVWAIGTGLTPSPMQIAEVHDFIRELLKKNFVEAEAFRVIYGGSVNPGNSKEILSINNVDGSLVGGASLKSEDFWAICKSV